ncbi:SDR family NAD(P)-dependent oxidoreductase [Phaeobacter inhibens]|uniref:SDR family NAD(P)-dependent oxidoreductase n=1 Tax=Phaeobacter inhibens TaxID=221822 RepID=UPI0021A378A5|nr:SDR family NAD(P)-dependent oxidoreductase [Phaeobacter inhibens]UWR52560.1 SDR family NAD(P)-dependent oxidoreductase [Phaeobacter inhibens]UWR72064.1 SDR family NAD(P)-dependent oxidoreductase [Phaeobacter inhibens]UWR75913.1 SDR family NAD(P)-dependent oxidoreductase [Phaeobacter inhibens]UWR99794.1 SDR family NAD(P)-dependent oxidoreductase [Phaeobacter inhibens]UWS03675.1 SDR family NAD(P)-dependent oxidoreductase [Phaeobacter inhibens]
MQKTILMTGCSSGIGLDAAHGMRERGWTVFASCRQRVDCDRLRAQGFISPLMDYTDAETLRSGLDEVLEHTGGTLDVLFNNGAHGLPGAVEDVSTDGLRSIFESNVFGWHELTRNVIPVMRAQGHGRIVQNSSILGFVSFPWRGAYVATKHAIEGLTDTMRVELRDSGIRVILIEPGPVTSKIREKAIPHFEKYVDWENSALRDRYETSLLKRLYESTGPDRFELPASAVTAKLVHACESRRPHPRYYVTVPTHVGGVLKRILTTRAIDRILARLR